MRRLANWKELVPVLLFCLACFVVPVGYFANSHRPLSAPTVGELSRAAIDAREEEIVDEMHSRFDGVSINHVEDFDPRDNPDNRWLLVQNSIADRGAPDAAAIVTQVRPHLEGNWPILAEPCSVNGQAAWLVIGSTKNPEVGTIIDWATDAQRRELEVERYCSRAQVVVVSAEAPYHRLN